MRKLYGFLLVLMAIPALANESPLDVLDQLRVGENEAKVETRIEVYEHGETISRSRLDVYVGRERRSLAVYRSQREAGQKVLMIGDQFWLMLPTSKRAIRITAMQKLMGEASVGDVASLDWSEDYRIVQQQVEEQTLHLSLEAAREGLSYNRVELWQDAHSLHPLRADLYLRSGKLAKQAIFYMSEEVDQWRVTGMALSDSVQKAQTTRIYYDQVIPMSIPDKWFNPGYLLRNTIE